MDIKISSHKHVFFIIRYNTSFGYQQCCKAEVWNPFNEIVLYCKI